MGGIQGQNKDGTLKCILLPRSESVVKIPYLDFGIWDFILLTGIFSTLVLVSGSLITPLQAYNIIEPEGG